MPNLHGKFHDSQEKHNKDPVSTKQNYLERKLHPYWKLSCI